MLIAFHILWIVNVIIVFRCSQLSFKSARTIAASYYRGAHGIIVAFDVTAARLKLCLNFSELIKWLTFEKWHCAYFAHICHTVQSVAVSGPVCGAFTIRNIINISSSKWISGPGILQECPAMDARDWPNMLQLLWTRCWWPRKQILCRNGLCLDQWVWTRIPCRSPFTRDLLFSKFAKHVLFAKVSEEEARELADELNLRYLETSAKHA